MQSESVINPRAANTSFRQVQDVLDCVDEDAATVEQAAKAWRLEEDRLPANAVRHRFRDALLAAIADGSISVYPPRDAGGSWALKVLR